ncbi:hypothetical protein CWI42_081380 [Ordospora colligata]|uniref:Uncharacterized protein n=1 Tax=Ordospora colligata OC4 TaxID=1354746 RepID=A0A0B2UK27_9MICR|nr:uncharacterized protein M896_081380 [Ordospora colligata OC4]KHN69402.1 hypothetical protein M896_081380 [Ordospora colligata OC4]TBU14916.1 hypothetical protein CWI41_081370 [Ordospora colligata]TBU15047.1 hypothetical protein CWI40_081390 [Ordospora colligata]TBU18301.1 hypothetical protein CWI42_081380 [Ordospora colligata]
MSFLIFMFMLFVYSESLGIRYDDIISKWVTYERRRMADKTFDPVQAMFVIEDGMPCTALVMGRNAISSAVEMFEDGFEGIPSGGNIENASEGRYRVKGYETEIDVKGMNYLCLKTGIDAFRHVKLESVDKVGIAYRTYFGAEQAMELGESLADVVDMEEVYVVPEALCGLVSKVGHIDGEAEFLCLVISMSGSKGMLSLYDVEIRERKRKFKNRAHVECPMVSDRTIQRMIYEEIEAELRRDIQSKEDVSDEKKDVTFYPRTGEGQLYDLKVDMKPVYKEVSKGLRYKEIVENIKIIEGVPIVDEEENVRYVVEAPVFNTGNIQKMIMKAVEEDRKKIENTVEKVYAMIDAERKDGKQISVIMRSEFSENPVFDEVFKMFGKREHVKAEDIEQGAARVLRSQCEVEDEKYLRVLRKESQGKRYLDEVKLRKDVDAIRAEVENDGIEKMFGGAEINEEDKFFMRIGEMNSCEELERVRSRWNELKRMESERQRELVSRISNLESLRKAIQEGKKKQKEVSEPWKEQIRGYVEKADLAYKQMSKDMKSRSVDIEDAELELVVKVKMATGEYDEKIRKEKEAKEAQQKSAKEVKEGDVRDNIDEEKGTTSGDDERNKDEHGVGENKSDGGSNCSGKEGVSDEEKQEL